MQNFQDSFEARKRSFIRAFSICMTVPLKATFSLFQLLSLQLRKTFLTISDAGFYGNKENVAIYFITFL